MSEIFQSLLSIYFQTIVKNFYQNKKASPVFFYHLGMIYKCYDTLFAISQIFFSLLRHVLKNITKFNKNIWDSPKTLWKLPWYISNSSVYGFHTHLTFTFSKSTLQTLEKGVFKVRMFEVNNKNTTMTPMTSFWCFYC